ncbi:MAG: hypothetical protein WBQ29_18130, partial [Isosphaeraceae bacterium]|jgi:hypothetical protein
MPSKERESGISTRATHEALAGTPARPPGLWAWGLCWLMFALTVLKYMDRQAIALVGPQIKAQFALDNQGVWLGSGGVSAQLCLLPVAGRLSG